jgi:hypothetical protein
MQALTRTISYLMNERYAACSLHMSIHWATLSLYRSRTLLRHQGTMPSE